MLPSFTNFLFFAGICRDVPGFNNLNADDQATLMEACYFDIWMVRYNPIPLLRISFPHMPFHQTLISSSEFPCMPIPYFLPILFPVTNNNIVKYQNSEIKHSPSPLY